MCAIQTGRPARIHHSDCPVVIGFVKPDKTPTRQRLTADAAQDSHLSSGRLDTRALDIVTEFDTNPATNSHLGDARARSVIVGDIHAFETAPKIFASVCPHSANAYVHGHVLSCFVSSSNASSGWPCDVSPQHRRGPPIPDFHMTLLAHGVFLVIPFCSWSDLAVIAGLKGQHSCFGTVWSLATGLCGFVSSGNLLALSKVSG